MKSYIAKLLEIKFPNCEKTLELLVSLPKFVYSKKYIYLMSWTFYTAEMFFLPFLVVMFIVFRWWGFIARCFLLIWIINLKQRIICSWRRIHIRCFKYNVDLEHKLPVTKISMFWFRKTWNMPETFFLFEISIFFSDREQLY